MTVLLFAVHAERTENEQREIVIRGWIVVCFVASKLGLVAVIAVAADVILFSEWS